MAKNPKKSFKNAPKPTSGQLAPELLAFASGEDVEQPETRRSRVTDARKYMVQKMKEEREATSRLSIDLPESLHRRYKAVLASNGLKMRSELVAFIELRVQELEKQAPPTKQ